MSNNIFFFILIFRGIRVDYVVDYNASVPSSLLVKFDKFLIELSIFSNLTEKIIIRAQTRRHSIEFRYCRTSNATNCTDTICDLSSQLESGYYIIKVSMNFSNSCLKK